MKKIIPLLIFLLLSLRISAQWQTVNSPNTTTTRYNVVEFLNDNVGFIGGLDSNIFQKTLDGGNTWNTYNNSQLSLPSGYNDLNTTSISFPNDSTGYLLITSYSTKKGWLYKTTTQGNSWSLIKSLYINGNRCYDMNFINSTRGALFFNGYLFTTKDGGSAWDSTFIANPIYLVSLSIYDTSRVRIDFQYYPGVLKDSVLYSMNFCDSLYNISGLSFPSSISKIDSISFGFKNGKLYKSSNYGITWNQIYDFTNIFNDNPSLFCYTADTIFIRGSNYIYRSDNGGLSWGKQITSIHNNNNLNPYINEFSKTQNHLYSIHEVEKKLIKTSNLGGNVLPILKVSSNSYTSKCPNDTLTIININDTSYNYYWTINGAILSTSFHLNFIIPDSGSTWQSYNLYLHVTNGTDEDSIKITVSANPSSMPGNYTAWVDPFVNCDGTYSVKVYPFYKKSWWPFNLANIYMYYDGSTYQHLGNIPPPSDPYANLGEPYSLSGDTATFHVSLHPDSIVSIRALSNYCGGGIRDTNLILPPYFYDFNLYPFDTDKEFYCTSDTVRIKIPYSNPNATYSIEGSYLINTPITGTGDTLEIIGRGNGNNTSYVSTFYVKYDDNQGCIKIKYDTVYMEGVNPIFQLVPDTVNVDDYLFLYNIGDSILLNLEEDTASISCLWNIESDLFDTTYINCSDHYFIVTHPGNYTIQLTKTSILGCVFESGIYQISVATGAQPFSTNLNCSVDTAFSTSFPDNSYQTLDIHEDKNGNFHLAGFFGGMVSSKPFYLYEKYNKSKQLLYRRVHPYSNYPANSSYNCSYLNSVTTDDNFNIYTSGQYYYKGNFKFDLTTIIYSLNSNINYWNTYAYVVKHDSSNNVKSLLLFAPNSYIGSSSLAYINPNFSDMLYLNYKVYALFNNCSDGKLLNYDMQNQNWINSSDIGSGLYLIEMDTLLNVEKVIKVSSSHNSIGQGFPGYGAYNSRAAKLAIDKQGRILIHYVSGYGGLNGSNIPIEYGPNTLISNYPLGRGHAISALATYSPQNGWLNGTLIGDGYVRNHNYVINNLESDVHGNKYVLSNFDFSNYDSFSWYTNQIYKTKDGIINNDTISRLSSTISKLDVNGNFIWNKHFKNCDVVDMKLTQDENHIGIIINAYGHMFFYGDNDTTMLGVNTTGSSTVFMQFSNNGVLEKMYEYGNGAKTVIGQFLHFNDDGYFQLSARISNLDSTELIVNGDTVPNPPFSTSYNYVTFSIDGENGQCSDAAYPGNLNDTLFIHLQNIDLCADSNVFIPWIATDTITNVNLGYYLNGSSTKIYITNNVLANNYGYLWSLPNLNNLDSVKFFIESVTPSFYSESNTFIFYDNQNIILLQDTTICLGDEVVLNPLDTFDLRWSPAQYFSNTELDSSQVLSLSDSTIIFVEARTNLNSCVNHDTININVITLIVGTDSITLCSGDSILLAGEYQYGGGIYIDSLQTHMGCDSVLYTTVTQLPAFGYAAGTTLCVGDSILVGSYYAYSGGTYRDTLTAINGCDSFITVTITMLPSFGSAGTYPICYGDSFLLGDTYISISGFYNTTLTAQNGCDSNVSVTLVVNPLPNVSIADFLLDTVCGNGGLVTLPFGTPSGGSYSGVGVSGGNFDPVSAGIGTHNVIYTFTDTNSCMNSDTTMITVELCTGIDGAGNDDFGILIYPNPNTGLFTIEKPKGLNKEIQVKLLDATSKLIIDKIIPIGLQKIDIDITMYSKGIYYLQLIVEDETFVKQILKN